MTSDPETVGPRELPPEVESALLRILDGSGEHSEAVRDLVAQNPEHADTIASFVADYRRAEVVPPARYGPYRVLGVLGEGGMGVVFRAVHDKIGHEVALKCMKRGWADDVPSRRRFEREVAAIARLDHPSICRMFEYGEDDGTPYFAMQLVDGVSLDRLIRAARGGTPLAHPGAAGLVVARPGQRPDLATVLTFGRHLLDALAAAHARGFVHRDIKPGNIMVDRRGLPVLLDFGLVLDQGAVDDRLTLSQMLVGTPGYMAPEQIASEFGDVGPRTDLHAVGLVLYELVAGTPAYSAASLYELQRKILRRDRVPLRRLSPGVSRDLEAIVDVATATLPAHRYVSASVFAEDLRRLQQHEPIRARRTGPVRRLQQWGRRNPVAATVLLAFTVALLLTGRLLWVTQSAAAATRRNLDRFFRLATAETLRNAEQDAAALYPASPENAPKLAAWLERYATPLAAELPRAREVLSELAAPGAAAGDLAAGSASVEQTERTASTFLVRTLGEVVPRLQAFLDEDKGLVGDVRRRWQWATTIVGRSVEAHAADWTAAIDAIRAGDGHSAHAAYAGLSLVPQVGLVPLGMDPHSHLWEFYDLATAAAGAPLPRRDAQGRLRMLADMGLVFVLIPGGTFAMGARVADAANVDADAEVDEAPVCQVTLAPFLLSKFEMTQAQWQRLTGESPSYCQPSGNDALPAGLPRYTTTNPVESVGWKACAEMARRQGLELPTEAQWEYACRAGSTAPFCFGVAGPECRRFANVADQTAQRYVTGWPPCEEWEDGHIAHAPVGTYEPNAFGLYDMHGNVLEFCADWKLPYSVAPASGSGLRQPPPAGPTPEFKIARGGCYQMRAVNARSADRHHYKPDQLSNLVGWRPSRALLLASAVVR